MKKIKVNFDKKYYDVMRDIIMDWYHINNVAVAANLVSKDRNYFTGIDCSKDGEIIFTVKPLYESRAWKTLQDLLKVGIIKDFCQVFEEDR